MRLYKKNKPSGVLTGGVQKFVEFRHKGFWGVTSEKEKPEPV